MYDSKFSDNKTNVENGITADGTLKLVTNVEVDENTTIDSIVESLNAKKEKNGSTTFNTENSDNKLNFVKLMENSDARTKGFDISSKTIQNSAFVFQSFLSNDVKIEATKPNTKNNSSITVTVQTQNNKEWNIDKLKKIEFNITIKHVKDLSKQIMFFSSEAASKLVKSDNTNDKIILKNTLNPDYQIKKDSNNPLNTISNNSIEEIKQWLTNGTIPNDPTKSGESSGEQSDKLMLNIFCQLIYSDIFTNDFTNVKAPSQESGRDTSSTITFKKEDLFPGVLTSNNITTKVNVTQKQTPQKLLSSKASLNNNIKVITIELTPNNNYWYGVNEELKNSTVVLELEIPAAKLERIYLFKGNWDNFKLKGDEFVFTNNLDENYAEFSWKDSSEVLKYFTVTPDNPSKEETPATNKLNEESFVKLFYKDVFKNAEFINDSTKSGVSGNEESAQKLSTLDVLPYLIDDDEINTKVEVKDKTNRLTFNEEKPTSKKGESKTVEITLTPKPGYGWSALYNSSNQSVKVNADKPVKFVLDINPSDALIPINGLLDNKLIKTYTSNEKGNKPVYWFECNSHDENKSIKTKFNYSNATEKIQDLVKKAVYAGPNQEAKTKTAASQLWTVNDETDKFTWDDKNATESIKNKKVSYLNKDFDLNDDTNFSIFKGLVINQDFINVSNETTSGSKEGQDAQDNAYLAVAGKTLWYLNESDKSNLAKQIKCSLMISTSIDTSTSNTSDKEIIYYVSFRLEPRNGGNWQNSNNNNPIDIDVTFDVKNAATIMDNTPTQSQKAGLTTPSPNKQGDKIEFEGTLKKDFFGEVEFNDAAAIEKHFEKQSSSGGVRKLNKASNIDLEKIRKLPTHLEGNLINKEIKDNQNYQSDDTPESKTFEFPGTNLSFKYLSDSDAPTAGKGGYSQRNLKTGDENYINDKLMFIKDLTVTENTDKTNKSLSDDEVKPTPKSYTIQFELELDKTKKTSWYWGSWNDLLPTNHGDANRSNQNLLIKLNVTI